VLYKQISHRFDGILLTISELVGRIEALETREGEKKSDICGPCGNQNTDVGTSVKGDGLKEEFVILMRAFVAEKENLRNSVELIEHDMETNMSVCIETVTELKQKISQLENEKADNKRVSTVEKTLNSVQSSANDLRSRTELIESRITEIQDSSSKIESRLGDVETNVFTVMVTMKR
jgi:chromosome segregation ATPase